MKFRKLRIAWSVFCGLACVLLVALWVRSYFRNDAIYGPLWGQGKTVRSNNGLAVGIREPKNTSTVSGWRNSSINIESRKGELGAVIGLDDEDAQGFCFFTNGYPPDSNLDSYADPQNCNWLGFHYVVEPGIEFIVVMPFWFLFLAMVAVTAAPWVRWQRGFSLRTLLIATSLVAVVLGLVVYAARH